MPDLPDNENVRKKITPELAEAIAKKVKEMQDIEYEPGQEIDLSDLGGDLAGWYIAYKT